MVGARQVGKSTSLWKRFVDSREAPLFINAEEILVRQWCSSATMVAADLAGLVRPGTPVLIDEAQHLEDAGLFMKGLIDSGVSNPIYVTGSSSFHLRARTRESMAGRAVRLRMHPLSLLEVSAELERMAPAVKLARTREIAQTHMMRGGYPEAWTSEAPQTVLRDLLEAFVIRDASDLFRLDRIDAFRKLLRLIAGQAGQIINVTEWASVCGVSRTAIANYLDILEDSHLVKILRPFAGGKRAELTSRPKVFFADSGLRNAVLGRFEVLDERVDRGAVFESWVAGELAKRIDAVGGDGRLMFWRSRSGAEVDFVYSGGGAPVAFEVKASAMREPRLGRSARSFIEAYGPSRFHVINLSLRAEEKVGETRVIWTGPEAMAEPDLFSVSDR